MPYKRRPGWWEEYGIHIQKSPTREVWVVGWGGMGRRTGGTVWEYDSLEAAEADVASFIDHYMESAYPGIVDASIEGGLGGREVGPSGRAPLGRDELKHMLQDME